MTAVHFLTSIKKIAQIGMRKRVQRGLRARCVESRVQLSGRSPLLHQHPPIDVVLQRIGAIAGMERGCQAPARF
ncbi:hypothetical protein [Burkholderia contaminans]|uniref:hypothetical protein n=1 Tax=Burkholderia contaminans TaxID=488447 RepID=UPI000AAD29C8|nr:hypothetical protein [Burkholderia contaminans]